MNINNNVIIRFLNNKGLKSNVLKNKNIAIVEQNGYNCEEIIELLKKQFEKVECYVNDLSNQKFVIVN
jgi:hypothetical protein